MQHSGECRPQGLRLQVPGNALAVRRALALMTRGLADIGQSAAQIESAEMVMAEVLNNVVEHAYDSHPGLIEIHFDNDPRGMVCTVLDDGRPMPGHALPQGHLPPTQTELALQPEGGFGWHLIRSLTRDLSYERRADRNRLSFRLPVVAG